jgi:hypothetical protein
VRKVALAKQIYHHVGTPSLTGLTSGLPDDDIHHRASVVPTYFTNPYMGCGLGDEALYFIEQRAAISKCKA